MVSFKTILIFLIIFIYKIVEARFRSVYSVGISGKLICSLRKTISNSALVTISKNPHVYVETNPIAKSYFSYGRFFNLIGYLKFFRPRHVYLKIIHDCYGSRGSRKRMLVITIPSNYLRKGYGILKLYQLYTVDLARMQGQSLYGSVKNSLKE
uniref:Transthyretin-like family-containing protein n=1 Tax=Strongyloides papillosus TaxID=174720 RepID=A0A0N5BJS1_STREA